MSFLNQVANASARRTSKYFTPGRFLVSITDVVEGTTRHDEGFIAVETKVIDSSDSSEHPAGCERTWYQGTSGKKSEIAARNIRTFLCRALDVPDSYLTSEMIQRAFSRDPNTGRSVLSGIKLIVDARNVETRAGGEFTLCDFTLADVEQTKL